MSEKIFNKTLIIGLGLIGGSFAKSLRENKISDKIYACDLDPDALEKAIKSEVINDFIELEDDLSGFDFIVMATPISAYDKIAASIKNKISPNAVIIDLGSIKEISIKKKLGLNFIPCHPIAGSEKTGFENSEAQLFLGKKFVICPENCDDKSVKKVAEIANKIGAEVEFLDAKKHDEIYALVSHLPQFLSFLTKEFSPKKITDEFFQTAFRLDNSDAEIWGDIFKMNDENLEKFYLEFFNILEENIKKSGKRSELSSRCSFDEKFFEENFAAIFFRTVVVSSYLEIPEIKTFQNYAGSGFRDFTSITAVLNYDSKKLAELLQKNHKQLEKLFRQLT